MHLDLLSTGFGVTPTTSVYKGGTGMLRAGTFIRSPMEGRNRDKDKNLNSDLLASEVRIIRRNLYLIRF
jgi:hypothetical protein